jgi:hypothetical protein
MGKPTLCCLKERVAGLGVRFDTAKSPAFNERPFEDIFADGSNKWFRPGNPQASVTSVTDFLVQIPLLSGVSRRSL